jgi:YD repeat-containing protein
MGVGVRGSDKQTYMPNSFFDYFFAEGTPVVYNTVHEYIGTPGTNIGKTVYEYDYDQNYLYQTRSRSSFVSPLIDDYRNSYLFGSLLGKLVYKVVNGNYVLQQKTGYQYEMLGDNSTITQVRQAYVRSDMAGGGALGSYNFTYEENYEFDYSSYAIQSGLKRLLRETDTTIENGVYLANKKVYEYDVANLYLPRKIKQYNSKGDSIVKINTYPTDLNTDPMYSAMISRNMISPVIEEVAKKNNVAELSRKKTNYNYSFTRILPVSVQSSIWGNGLETEVTFNQYDAQGNLLEYLDKSGITTSIVWGYNYSLPVARITGASYSAVHGAVNVAALQSLTGQALRDALSPLYSISGLTNVYTYEPLKGLSSQTDPSGKIVFYEYDAFSRLKLIKDLNGKILKQYDYQYKAPITQ